MRKEQLVMPTSCLVQVGATRGDRAIGCAQRRFGRGCNTARVGGSVPDIMEGGAQGGIACFEFKFMMVVGVSLI